MTSSTQAWQRLDSTDAEKFDGILMPREAFARAMREIGPLDLDEFLPPERVLMHEVLCMAPHKPILTTSRSSLVTYDPMLEGASVVSFKRASLPDRNPGGLLNPNTRNLYGSLNSEPIPHGS